MSLAVPNALMLVTRWMFVKVGRYGGCVVPQALKIISYVLFWFNLRLLSDTH